MSGFYLNELLLKLTTRHDPNAGLFDGYREALVAPDGWAAPGAGPCATLKLRLLQEVGYGLDLTQTVAGAAVTEQGVLSFSDRATVLFYGPALNTRRRCAGQFTAAAWRRAACGTQRNWRTLARCCWPPWSIVWRGRPIATRGVARACVGTALVA